MEAKVAVTPMLHGTRLAGTMEFSGINKIIRSNRVGAIAHAAEQFYKELVVEEAERETASSGLRPVSPDGLPYIGKAATIPNVTIATGHAMMGWSLGPITGKLVAELINDVRPSMDMSGFMPERFN